jgi:hypothetical protein
MSAEALKAQGNAAFQRDEYNEAIRLYSKVRLRGVARPRVAASPRVWGWVGRTRLCGERRGPCAS